METTLMDWESGGFPARTKPYPRARGSRSLVVAVVPKVTKGPPSKGAASLKATSGMSLGLPPSGKSLRNG